MCRKLMCLISFVLLSLLGPATIVSADLIGYWPLDGNPNDLSGNGYDGVAEGGVTYGEGVLGLAADFNGSNALIDCGDIPVGDTGAITIAFWVKPRNIAQDWAGYVSKWTLDNAQRTFWLGQHSTAGWLRFGIYPGGPTAETFIDSGQVILANEQWTHIACTYDGDIQRIYADGVEVVSSPERNVAIVDRGGNLRFGIVSTANWFNGLIDDVQIYSEALPETEIQAIMMGISMQQAGTENPANEATDVPREVVLSWEPGKFAAPTNGHKVYFGESFDDVNDATGGGAQTAASYTPAQRLDFGKTYYWRVDEVNAPPTSHIEFKGKVWSFTVEPIAYPIDGNNITATASSSNSEDEGPENTINGSRLDANDLHSAVNTDMWLSNAIGPQPSWIQYEFDKVYKLHQMLVWNHNSLIESVIGFGVKDAAIEYSVDGNDYTTLGTTHEFARGPSVAGYAANTTIDLSGVAAKYVKITANSNWGGIVNQYGLSEVRFLYIPVWAREPNPASGATDVDVDLVLSFRAGREAAEHNVYISTDEQAVIDSNVPVSIVTEAQDGPISLDLDETYYWKVNEVNEAETTTTWQGEIWNFSTPDSLVVEDFESYNDIPDGEEGSNLVYLTWIDGYENPSTNGSTIGYVEAFQPSMETDIVHGGKQSVPLMYNNSLAAYSEATVNIANLPIGSDWTKHGVKSLSLWFSGDPTNAAEQMYVKLNSVKVPYDGDSVNISKAVWQPWNIHLTDFGVDLSNVTELSIGFERGAGGSGKVLFDDIRLYPFERQLITPTEPSNAGLMAYYEFEGTYNDSSGNGQNGIAMGEPTFVAGKVGQAIDLDGIDDFVDLGIPEHWPAGAAPRTLCAWAQTFSVEPGWRVIAGYGSPAGGQGTGVVMNGTSLYGSGYGSDVSINNFWAVEEWHHVGLTYDGTTVRLYADGVEVVSGEVDWNTVITVARIGRQVNEAPEFWDGRVDEVRLYDQALSLAEMAWLAGVTKPFDKPF